jgi:hypothetical protein
VCVLGWSSCCPAFCTGGDLAFVLFYVAMHQ